MVSVESRRSENGNVLEVLGRLAAELDKMGGEHLRHSQADYLRQDGQEKPLPA